MKMIRKALAGIAMAAAMAAPALADYPSDVGDKFARGLSNTALGWTEFFKNTYNVPAQHGMLFVPVGVMKGAAHVCGRTALGIVDLITFPIPSQSLVHASHIWENVSAETSYGEQ